MHAQCAYLLFDACLCCDRQPALNLASVQLHPDVQFVDAAQKCAELFLEGAHVRRSVHEFGGMIMSEITPGQRIRLGQ